MTKVSSANAENTSAERRTPAITGRAASVRRQDDGHFYIDVTLEGWKVEALIDTGASVLIIPRPTAERLGRSFSERDFKYRFSTANGTNRAARIKLQHIRVGGKDLSNIDAYVAAEGLDIALLGQDVLTHFQSVEMSGDVLSLRW